MGVLRWQLCSVWQCVLFTIQHSWFQMYVVFYFIVPLMSLFSSSILSSSWKYLSSPLRLNSCIEVCNVLGIMATCNTIMKELRGIMEFDSSYANYCHLALLCHLMTHCRTLMAITHHGINCADTGALMHCSFKETVEILIAMVWLRTSCLAKWHLQGLIFFTSGGRY